MSGEITRRLASNAVERQHAADVDHVHRQAALVVERINAVAMTGNVVMTNTLLLTLIQQEVERMAPASADRFALVVNTAFVQMIQQMQRLG